MAWSQHEPARECRMAHDFPWTLSDLRRREARLESLDVTDRRKLLWDTPRELLGFAS